MSTLKSALKMFIDEVEKLDENTVFNMRYHSTCVIGFTLGWDDVHPDKKEHVALKKYFGIKNKCYSIFCSSNPAGLNIDQWMVIRLFTVAIGGIVTKQEWLKLANNQLEQMK